MKDFSKVGESVVRHGHSEPLIKFALTDLMIEWTGVDHTHVGTANTKVGCSPSVAFVVGIVLSLF